MHQTLNELQCKQLRETHLISILNGEDPVKQLCIGLTSEVWKKMSNAKTWNCSG